MHAGAEDEIVRRGERMVSQGLLVWKFVTFELDIRRPR